MSHPFDSWHPFWVYIFNMATKDYGKYRLVSRPQKNHRGWVPFVMITWQDGKDVRSHIENPDKVCPTEEEAVDSGFEAARDWITKER